MIDGYLNSTWQPATISANQELVACSKIPSPATTSSNTDIQYATAIDKYGHPMSATRAAAVAAAVPDSEERVRFVHIGKTGGGTIEDAALRNRHLWG